MTKRATTFRKPGKMPLALSLLLASQLGLSTCAWSADAENAEMLQNKSLPVPTTLKVETQDLVDAATASGQSIAVKTEIAPSQVSETAVVKAIEEAPQPGADTPDPKNSLSLGPIPYVPAAPTAPQVPAAQEAGLPASAEAGPIIIDNDEEVETKATIKYEEMATDEGKTHIKAGARFPVVMQSELNSKTTKKGDPFQARLKYDVKIGDRHVANKGSIVTGHVNYVLKARTILGSIITVDRFYRNSGVLGFEFDELINEKGEHIRLVAMPARMARIVKNKAEGRELGVNHKGQITGPWSTQLRYKAVRIGLNFALAPLGPMTFGAMPVVLGCIGAANPDFAFAKPVGLNVRHRRLKGFFWGALSGVPGSWLIEDTTVRGQEAIIKPGDEFLAEMNQEFTGEPITDAEIMPGASTKVRGSIVKEKTKSKK